MEHFFRLLAGVNLIASIYGYMRDDMAAVLLFGLVFIGFTIEAGIERLEQLHKGS